MWPKGGSERNIGRIPAARDGNTSDPRHVMARVEGKPASVEEDFEPRVVIHRSWIRRHADVAQKPIGVTRAGIFMQRQKATARWARRGKRPPAPDRHHGRCGWRGHIDSRKSDGCRQNRKSPEPGATPRGADPNNCQAMPESLWVFHAITAAERKNQCVVWQSFDRDLFGIELDRIGLAAILDDRVAANRQIARSAINRRTYYRMCRESLRRNCWGGSNGVSYRIFGTRSRCASSRQTINAGCASERQS